VTMVGAMTRHLRWHDLWFTITGRRLKAEPETAVVVALQDIDLGAFEDFDGRMAYGLEADRRKRRPSRRKRLRKPVGLR
jgi:hypothetical protein